jgi:hypothetical protein
LGSQRFQLGEHVGDAGADDVAFVAQRVELDADAVGVFQPRSQDW